MGFVKRFLLSVLGVSLAVTSLTGAVLTTKERVQAEELTLSNPHIVPDESMKAEQKVTWDCIWFGSYPQAEVISDNGEYMAVNKKELLQEGDLIQDSVLYQKLEMAQNWDKKGNVFIDGEKYKRIREEDVDHPNWSNWDYWWEDGETYHYFKYQPIKWRVLSTDGFSLFLLADKALDVHRPNRFYKDEKDLIWESNTMRSWLNGYEADFQNDNFIDSAFSHMAQLDIRYVIIENGIDSTMDKMILLSDTEVSTDLANKYGFTSGDTFDEARRAKSSLYAKAMGVGAYFGDKDVGTCSWWLRSPNDYFSFSYVGVNGSLSKGYHDYISDDPHIGVRPALKLSLSSEFWSYAGTVCSDRTIKEVSPETAEEPTTSPVPTVEPEMTGKPTVSPSPTLKPEITNKPPVSPSSSMEPEEAEDNKTNTSQKLNKGSEITDNKTKAVYKIIGTGKSRTAEYIKSTKKKLTSVVIPDALKLKGETYKVTSIGKRAFKGSKRLKTVKIGKNVKTIGEEAFSKCAALTIIKIPSKVAKIKKKAFYQCRDLQYILVKTNKLTARNVGKNAFGKGAFRPRVKTDKRKWKLYSKIFMNRGMSKKALFIIDPVKLII